MSRVSKASFVLLSVLIAIAALCAACGTSTGGTTTSATGATSVSSGSVATSSSAATSNTIQGSVAFVDRSAQGQIKVGLFKAGEQQVVADQAIDTQGTYAFSGLSDGTYHVFVSGTGSRTQNDVVAVQQGATAVKNYVLSKTSAEAGGAEARGMLAQHQYLLHLVNSMHNTPATLLAMHDYNLSRNLTNKRGRKGTVGAVTTWPVPGATYLAVDGGNNVWVSTWVDSGNTGNGLVKLDNNGTKLLSGATSGSADSGGGVIAVNGSSDVALSNHDKTLSVVPGGNLAQAAAVSSENTFTLAIAPQNVSPARFIVVLSPLANPQIRFLSVAGALAPITAALPAGFTAGRGLAVDPADNSFYVAGTVPNAPNPPRATLLHIDADGANLLETITLGATESAAAFTPQNMARNSQGELFVASTSTSLPGLVKVAGSAGARSVTPITVAHQDGATFRPTGLAIDPQDNVWALDSPRSLATRLDAAAANPTDVTLAASPATIATDSQGNAFVIIGSSAEKSVVKIDGQGTTPVTETLDDGSTLTLTPASLDNQFVSTVVHTVPNSPVASVANFGPSFEQPDGSFNMNVISQTPIGEVIQVTTVTFTTETITYTTGGAPDSWEPLAVEEPPPPTTIVTTPPVIVSQGETVVGETVLVSQSEPIIVSESAPVFSQGTIASNGAQTFNIKCWTGMLLLGTISAVQSDGTQIVDLRLRYPDYETWTGLPTGIDVTGTIFQNGSASLNIRGYWGWEDFGSQTAIITNDTQNHFSWTLTGEAGGTTAGEGNGYGFENFFVGNFLNQLSFTELRSSARTVPGQSGFEILAGETPSDPSDGCGPGYNHVSLGAAIPIYEFNPLTAQVETTYTSEVCTTGFHEGGGSTDPTLVNQSDLGGLAGAAGGTGNSDFVGYGSKRARIRLRR